MDYVKSRRWATIAKFYEELVEEHGHRQFEPMLRLVQGIVGSRYAEGLHGATSHATLLIAQTPEFDPVREVLHIDFADGTFRFKFVEGPYVEREWSKSCGPNEGFSTLEHLLVRLKKWFVEQ
jgi:hypothetical protein